MLPEPKPRIEVGDLPDQREARRVALLLKVGKLVCEDGEFLCILRDASNGGVKARVFHALPEGQAFSLELSNGEAYPVELVWQRDDHAGFRFVEQKADVVGLVDEISPFPKRGIRVRLEVPVNVRGGENERAGVLLDLSQHGARIEIDPILAIGEQVTLTVRGLPELVARVRWRRRVAHGVIFQRGFRLDELAALAARLQQESLLPEESIGKAG